MVRNQTVGTTASPFLSINPAGWGHDVYMHVGNPFSTDPPPWPADNEKDEGLMQSLLFVLFCFVLCTQCSPTKAAPMMATPKFVQIIAPWNERPATEAESPRDAAMCPASQFSFYSHTNGPREKQGIDGLGFYLLFIWHIRHPPSSCIRYTEQSCGCTGTLHTEKRWLAPIDPKNATKRRKKKAKLAVEQFN